MTNDNRRTDSASDLELRRLFDMSLQMLCIAGVDGYFKRLNPAFERVLGYSREELLSRPFVDFVHPDDRDATVKEVGKLVKGAQTVNFTNRYRTKDGSYRWLAWTSAPHRDGLLYATATDVTDLKRSQELSDNLLHHAPDPVIIADNDGKILRVNALAVSVFGYAEDELLGKPIEMLVPERLRSAHAGHRNEYRANPHIRPMGAGVELSAVRRNGTEFPAEISLGPIETDEGTVVICSVRDISERKRAELVHLETSRKLIASLERSQEELESEVSKRTRKLRTTQAQLVQSAKMASLGQLVAGIVHEINTPLGAIKSVADTTLRCAKIIERASEKSGDTVRDELDRACRVTRTNSKVTSDSVDQISRVVRSLKNFARLDEGDCRDADIHEGIDSTLVLLDGEFSKKKATVSTEYGDVPHLTCDPVALNQVFMHLLLNAVGAIKEGGTIRIRTFAEDGRVHVAITDTGYGIAPENMEKIWDPGYTTKGVHIGTALGLSISLDIVRTHNGEIRVKSEPDVGSTFTVVLPFDGPTPE